MQSVGQNNLRKFLNTSLLKMHFCAFVGFLGGVKLCDAILFDEQPFKELTEDLEDQYWVLHGVPTEIVPYSVPSIKQDGGIRKSWIYIMYEKDKLIKKKDQME